MLFCNFSSGHLASVAMLQVLEATPAGTNFFLRMRKHKSEFCSISDCDSIARRTVAY